MLYDVSMSIEERIARMEKNLDGLARVQDQMMDLLGFTMEGERRLATRQQRTEEIVAELSGKLDGLISVVDGIVRRG